MIMGSVPGFAEYLPTLQQAAMVQSVVNEIYREALRPVPLLCIPSVVVLGYFDHILLRVLIYHIPWPPRELYTPSLPIGIQVVPFVYTNNLSAIIIDQGTLPYPQVLLDKILKSHLAQETDSLTIGSIPIRQFQLVRDLPDLHKI